MIPHSFISGTFYNASGSVRANEQITFMPLSTPYAVDGELVLSLPQIITLDGSGRITDGTNLWYKLAKGYYRVIASDTDAFFISISDDELVHDIDSLASQLGAAPSGLQRVYSARDIFSATQDSRSVTRSLKGRHIGDPMRLIFIGESGDLSADTVFPSFITGISAHQTVVLGNANPGGSAATIAAKLAPWDPFITAETFWYAMGNQDWTPGNVNAVTNYLTTPGLRYFKRSFDMGSGTSLALFVIDSNDLEPDGNTSSSTQATWLQTQLAASSERWKIVAFRDTPFVSVSGGGKAAMDWPFAAWGAHAVIAAGAAVMEHIILTGGIPLFVSGCAGTGSKDVFGTPLSGSMYRGTNIRAAVVLTANIDSMFIHVINLTTGALLHEVPIQGPEDQLLSFAVNVAWDSGLRAGSTLGTLELEPYGLAKFSVDSAQPIENVLKQTHGVFIRMSAPPTASDVAANPQLRNSMIAVGDDPVRFWWWNKAKNEFVEARFSTYDGVSYYNGTRTQLAAPTFSPTPGTNCLGTVINHADSAAQMWISENGEAFSQWTDWPTKKLYLFQQSKLNEPVFLAAFVRRAGYIDSDILSGTFLPA